MKKFGELKKGENIYFIEKEKNEYVIKKEVIAGVVQAHSNNNVRIDCKIKSKYHWVPGAWSRYALICASEEVANSFIEKTLKKEKIFFTLMPGDVLYAVNEKYDTPLPLTVHKISNENCKITIKSDECGKKSEIYFGEHEFYLNRSSIDGWYLRGLLPKGWNDGIMYKIFIKNEDAIKYIATTREKNAKKAADKYITDLANFGKPITMKDNKGNTLHYGDKIAYVRRNGIHAHTDISFGIVMGESKTKIKILDEEEQKEGKKSPFSYHDELIGSNGLHALESQNVLFISPGEKKMMTFAK